MRLTLRTLLAYMDDILDPADQDNLAKQVTESEKASELIHRTRDATRRLRLGAPPVLGEGMELDPNYAAEYLDSTLSADDMSEYQQVCLDSDVHLAEVASCHHILTMVLGEPAEIDPEMRERMYQVPGRVDEWHRTRVDTAHAPAATAAPEPAAADAPAAIGQDEPVSHVPDYLKAEEPSKFGRLALAFAAALVLGFGAFMLFGPGGILSGEGDQNLAQGDEPSATAPGPETPAQNGGEEQIEPVPPLGPDTPEPVNGTPEGESAGTTEPIETIDESTDEGVTIPEAMATSTPPEIDPGVGTDPVPEPGTGPTGGEAAVAGGEAGDEGRSEGGGMAAAVEATTTPEEANALVSGPVEPPAVNSGATQPEETDTQPPIQVTMNTSEGSTAGEAGEGAADAGVDAPLPPPEAAPIGTMYSPNQVLLRFDEDSADWYRLPQRSSVMAGDQLLSLPTYRPSLSLISVLRVELCDGAEATVGYAEDGQSARVELAYGRFLLQNTGMEPTKVELVVSGESRTVELASTGVLGLDVDRPFVVGADVESSLGQFVATFYAPGGRVIWDVEGVAQPIDQPAQWSWEDPTPKSITDNVEWLDGQSLDYLEQNVSKYFEKQMTSDQPARVQTLELYESSRRREDKALAAVCGTHVGQFVPFVQALADTQQQSNWDEHIAEMRRAMSRSTQAAKLVHQTITEQRGAALADDLFEMLRGYTPEQIGTTPEEVQAGKTRQLIDWLKHDRLEYRVLAIYNLRQIYGGKTLGYNPVVTKPTSQDHAVRQWRTRLADNELEPTFATKN